MTDTLAVTRRKAHTKARRHEGCQPNSVTDTLAVTLRKTHTKTQRHKGCQPNSVTDTLAVTRRKAHTKALRHKECQPNLVTDTLALPHQGTNAAVIVITPRVASASSMVYVASSPGATKLGAVPPKRVPGIKFTAAAIPAVSSVMTTV